MTFILKQVFELLKLLNSDKETGQISVGIALGTILGFSPTLSLQTFIVFFCLFCFRIQIAAAFLSAFFFSFAAYLIDPLAHSIGTLILEHQSLQDLFTQLYNMPLIPLTRFNNSVVMGSAVIGGLLSPFVFFGARFLIQKYRDQIVSRFKSSKFWKVIQATAFYKWYVTYEQLFG